MSAFDLFAVMALAIAALTSINSWFQYQDIKKLKAELTFWRNSQSQSVGMELLEFKHEVRARLSNLEGDNA